MISKAIIAGRLTKDAEFKTTSNGTMIANFTVASDYWNGKENKASFFNFVLLGKFAESYSKRGVLTKGTFVIIDAEVRQEVYKNKEGNSVSTIRFYPNRIDLGPGSKRAAAEAKPADTPVIDEVETASSDDEFYF